MNNGRVKKNVDLSTPSKLLYQIFHCLVVGHLLRLIVLLVIINNYPVDC